MTRTWSLLVFAPVVAILTLLSGGLVPSIPGPGPAPGAAAQALRLGSGHGHDAGALPAGAAAASENVTVYYKTAWPAANLHYNDGSGTWTASPGVAMSNTGGYFVRTVGKVAGQPLTFVFNNGAGTWDNNGNNNYVTTLASCKVEGGTLVAWPSNTPNPAGSITIHYKSAWPAANMHYNDGAGWTAAPGKTMEAYRTGWFRLTAPASTLTFCFNNGAGTWDSKGGANYVTALSNAWIKDQAVLAADPESGDVTAPDCVLTAPATGATLSGTATVTANAADNVGVTLVIFRVGGTEVGRAVAAPWSATFDTRPFTDGAATLTAIAFDAAGNSRTAAVNVTISNPVDTAYTVRYWGGTARAVYAQVKTTGAWSAYPGQRLAAGPKTGWFTWSATLAAAPRLQFTLAGGKRDSNGGPGYLATAASVWIKGGLVTTTDPDLAVDQPPQVVSVALPGATVSGAVLATAQATDDKGVAKVGFYLDGTLVSEDAAAPYECTLDTTKVADGQHTLRAVATDTAGQAGETSLVFNVHNSVAGKKTIHYKTAWTAANIHYNNGAGWTVAPGAAMAAEATASWWVKTVDSSAALTFCFNNGSTWDSNGGSNYTTTEPEVWVKDNKVYTSFPDETVPPTVRILFPQALQTVTGSAVLRAETADAAGVVRVEFVLDGNKTVATRSTNAAAASWTLAEGWDSAYAANGTHELTVKAYDAAGNVGTAAVTFATANPNLPPLASAGGALTACLGKPVQLNGTGSSDPNGTIVDWTWTSTAFGTLKGAAPSVTFNQLGSFNVLLTVTDNEGATASDQMTVTVTTNVRVARDDFREESIYFLITTRFYDGDPANTRKSPCYESAGNDKYNDPENRGDFKGLIEKLDYIKALGFSAIWITPPVLNRNYYDYHGYHAWDLTKIDGRLESPGATYQDLINTAHAKGIKIVQDIVLNHSGRYGFKGQAEIKYWGDREDPEWGANSKIKYYDEANPAFTYDGVSVEPKSGKWYYNGDLWQKEAPQLPWQGQDEFLWWEGKTINHKNDIANLWGVKSPYHSPEGYQIWHFQWPGMYEAQFSLLDPKWFHCFWLKNWEDYTCQFGTIHEDCLDLNTESPTAQNYLINAYNRYIAMGVDGFRIDTVKHISRNTFNRRFNPAFHAAAKANGNNGFYMFGEVCVRDHGVWNKGIAPLSVPFYTWAERKEYSADDLVAAKEAFDYENGLGGAGQPTSLNHLLDGNNYRAPDYSKASGLNVIDFRMHWNFKSASSAFNIRDGDQYMNDATWAVTYVESHDYSPWEVGNSLYARSSDETTMAESWSLMFTWRGIPCIYYGNEIMFKAGCILDKGPNMPLEESGRAYFGNHITGSVQATDFGTYQNATGNLAATLAHPLAQHVRRLNLIRRAVPALQKGQYSTEGVSGGMAYKRRFTDAAKGVDSFCLVNVSGDATFSGIPNGTYKDAVTGATQTVSGGALTSTCAGTGNLRVWVLDLPGGRAPGKVGEDGKYLK